MRIGYGKLGRSMPLTLERCGNLGGDVEMAAVVGELARRHPEHEFWLLGRNSGERPRDVGLPDNVVNPWTVWAPELRARMRYIETKGGLTTETQRRVIDLFDSITLEMFRQCDQHVWWVGQHGTTNMPLPKIDDRSVLTKPQDWSIYYASFILRGINAWRDVDPLNREEVWLNADARNRHKMRDLKWPLRHPILTQFNFTNNLKHERFIEGGDEAKSQFATYWDQMKQCARDGQRAHRHWENLGYEEGGAIWRSIVQNVYSRLEVNGLRPGTPFGDLISFNDEWDRPGRFGLFINEARAIGVRPELARLPILKQWVLPLQPDFIHGTWSDRAMTELGFKIVPAPWSLYYPRLHSVRCTFTTPSSGSGWATAKPWEAFAGGTVCFFHPAYDTQDNILGDADPTLREWLRVRVPEELERRVRHLSSESGRPDWEWLVMKQREHFDAAMTELRYIKMIEERIGL